MTSTRELTDLRARLQLALGTGYDVGAEIGKGGMSRVFAARDLTLKREIVVKTLPPELGGDISVERFKREIHFAASLQHPHIVPVHAAGDVDGLPYYTMPRVEGESLRDRLNRVQRLPLTEVLTVMRDVGRALAYAHRRGLVHRDIKPENILIAEGMAVVTDFGIAKAVAAAREDHPVETGASSSTHTGLTAAGTYLGTPNYIAPEQMVADAAIDHRADLFAFGVVAYELLSGETPFASRGGAASGAQFAFPPRDIAAQRLDVAPVVAQLVMQCLEIDPNARPQSADEIVRKLDAAMSATPLAPVGDDPSVTRKAFAWYAVAFVLATGLAWVAMIGLGLPDWVFPGTMILMALGLPVVTTVALTRRAAALSSLERVAEVSRVGWLFTPGPTTIRLAQALTWRRVVTGGGLSLGAFGVLVGGFMVTRSLGIGPAASLLSAGQITKHQFILLTDFTVQPGDSAIGRLSAEAVRIAFQESDVVRLVPPATVAEALRRMRRAPTERLTLSLARDIAVREGISVVADGEVIRERSGFLLTVRLVATDSGNVLARRHVVAASATDLVASADRLTRELRSAIGESLKRVRSSPPLQKATTASLDALVLFTQAVYAHEMENNLSRSRDLLMRALELDSTFAAAWRRLSVVTSYLRPAPRSGWKPNSRDALEQAFRHRYNSSTNERLEIEGQYYWATADPHRALAAFEEYAVRTGVPLENHAWSLLPLRQFARSESLYRVLFRVDSTNFGMYNGLFSALMNQGKDTDADSAAHVARRRFPNVSAIRVWTGQLLCGQRKFEACEASLDSIRSGREAAEAHYSRAELALMRGMITRWKSLVAEGDRIRAAEVNPGGNLSRAAWVDVMLRHEPAEAKQKLDSLPDDLRVNRAWLYAWAGELDSARVMIRRLESQGADSVLRQDRLAGLQYHRASLAVAAGRGQDALRGFRASDRLSNALARDICVGCVFLELALVFDRSSVADSAVYYYERFLSTPLYSPYVDDWVSKMRFLWWNLINEAWIRERLGELYERKGDRDNAVRHLTAFVELWKDADPELQPRVATARTRLTRLKAS